MSCKQGQTRGRPIRILLVGSQPPPVGGTAISFQLLIDQLNERGRIVTRVINTSGIRGHLLTGPFRLLSVLARILVQSFRVDVISLHQVPSGLAYLGPFAVMCAWLARKPLILRIFAGIDYMDATPFRAWLSHFVARHSSIYLAQTKELVRLAKERRLAQVRWYPTSRPMPLDDERPTNRRGTCRRFAMIGHVNDTKGVLEILAADQHLRDDIVVDVYGPLTTGIRAADFNGAIHVRYRGPINNDEVIPTLREYDALLLPTYHQGEGYPGVILEAYAAGLPVICTRWKALPELVDDSSGILVPIKDVEALCLAMTTLAENDDLYAKLCMGARKKRQDFSLTYWVDYFVDLCREVAGDPISKSTEPRYTKCVSQTLQGHER